MFARAISRTKFPNCASIVAQCLTKTLAAAEPAGTLALNWSAIGEPQVDSHRALGGWCGSRWRLYHDGRPRGPLWRGKKLIGKEALFVILGMKRFKDDEDKLDKFVKNHVLRLLKLDKIAVLTELQRQEQVALALKGYPKRGLLWEDMRKDDLFPDSQTYTEVIRGFLRQGSPADAMNIYEDMLKSPEPPEELPFRILLKGLLPHPLLRNKVKKDFEEIFPESHVYDPPEEIFGMQ